jgi:hypothetical protein
MLELYPERKSDFSKVSSQVSRKQSTRIELFMKRRGSNDFEKSKAPLRTHLSKRPDEANRDPARIEAGMTVLWFILGTVCAGLAWVLGSILLK